MYQVRMISEGYGKGYFVVVDECGKWFGGLQLSYSDAASIAWALNHK